MAARESSRAGSRKKWSWRKKQSTGPSETQSRPKKALGEKQEILQNPKNKTQVSMNHIMGNGEGGAIREKK